MLYDLHISILPIHTSIVLLTYVFGILQMAHICNYTVQYAYLERFLLSDDILPGETCRHLGPILGMVNAATCFVTLPTTTTATTTSTSWISC